MRILEESANMQSDHDKIYSKLHFRTLVMKSRRSGYAQRPVDEPSGDHIGHGPMRFLRLNHKFIQRENQHEYRQSAQSFLVCA